MENHAKILVVDDEESLCEILQFNLEIEGFTVETANSAEEALKLDISKFDLILLDIMMGAISGLKMAQMLKRDIKTEKIPIIFCTAKDTEDDTVIGLTLGADDYISKPYKTRELIARVKSVLRRNVINNNPAENHSKNEFKEEIIEHDGLRINLTKITCDADGREVPLTKKEFEILVLLIKNQGKIFSRKEILDLVWSDEVIVLGRTVDVNITRLRKKIGRYGENIVTRLGYGYGFEA